MSEPRPLALGLLPHLLPQPIALACRRVDRASATPERAAGIVDVALTGLHFLAAISTAEALASTLDAAQVDPHIREALTGREPRRWWTLLLRLAEHEHERALPELHACMTDTSEEAVAWREAVEVLVALLQDPGLHRQRFMEDVEKLTNEETLSAAETFLHGLAFLTETSIVTTIRSHGEGEATRHLCRRHHGIAPQPTLMSLELGDVSAPPGRPLLVVHSNRRVLKIFPMVTVVESSWGSMLRISAPTPNEDSKRQITDTIRRFVIKGVVASEMSVHQLRVLSSTQHPTEDDSGPAAAVHVGSEGATWACTQPHNPTWIHGLTETASGDEQLLGIFERISLELKAPHPRLVTTHPASWCGERQRAYMEIQAPHSVTLHELLLDGSRLPAAGMARVTVDLITAFIALEERNIPIPSLTTGHVLVDAEWHAMLSPYPLAAGGNPESDAIGPIAAWAEMIRSATSPRDVSGLLNALKAPTSLTELLSQVEAEADLLGAVSPRTLPATRLTTLQNQSPGHWGNDLKKLMDDDSPEDPSSVAHGLVELAPGSWDATQRASLLTRAGHLRMDAGLDEEATVAFRLALEAQPGHGAASNALENQAEALEDWQVLSELLLDRLLHTEVWDERHSVLWSLSEIFEHRLGDPSSAFFVHDRVLRESPNNEKSQDKALAMGASAGLHDEVVALCERVAATQSTARQAILLQRAAEIHFKFRNAPEDALRLLQKVIHHHPTLEALELRAQVLKTLGRHADALRAFEATSRYAENETVRATALAEAAGCAGALEQWDECIRLLQAQAICESPESAAHTWLIIAGMYIERLGDEHEMSRSLARAGALAPEDSALQSQIRDIASQGGDALRQTLESQLAQAGEDTERRVTALLALTNASQRLDLPRPDEIKYRSELVDLRPGDGEVADALEEMYVEDGEWTAVEELLSKRLRQTSDHSETRALALRRHRVMHAELRQPGEAAEQLLALVKARPDDEEIAKAIAESYAAAGEWDALIGIFEFRAHHLNEGDQADVLVHAAAIAHEELTDRERGIRLLERALEVTPGHKQALERLGSLHVEAEEWERALPLLTLRAKRMDDSAPREVRTAAWTRVARAAHHLLLHENEAQAWDAVLHASPEDMDAMEGLAEACQRIGDSAETEKQLRALLALPEDRLQSARRGRIEKALADLVLDTGSATESMGLLESALQTDPHNQAILRQLIQACDRAENWEAAIRWRKTLLEELSDPMERFRLWRDVSDLAGTRTGDHAGAAAALKEALKEQPDSQATLAALLESCLTQDNYTASVDVLLQMSAGEVDPTRRASHLLTIALIHRDQLGDADGAIRYLNETLNTDALRLEAFEALDAILVAAGDVPAQIQSYERMLERIRTVDETEELSFRLLLNLGQLQQTLEQRDKSQAAFLRATEIRPEDPRGHALFAAALALDKETIPEALNAFRTALRLGGPDPAIVRQIRRLFTHERRTDAAWNACGVLEVLGAAGEKESTYFANHREGALKVSKTIKDDEMWTELLHPTDEVASLGRLFDALLTRIPDLVVGDDSGADLLDSSRIDLTRRSTFTNFARAIPRILGVGVPAYHATSTRTALQKAPTAEHAILVGSDSLASLKGKRLRFLLGRVVTLHHPLHSLSGVQTAEELQNILSALRVVVHNVTGQGEIRYPIPPPIHAWSTRLSERLTVEDVETLVQLAPEAFEGKDTPSVVRWLDAVDLTACRAGLLLCNDIQVAISSLESTQDSQVGKAPTEQLAHDLIGYAISPEYLSLREKMGIAIQ